MNKFYFLFAAVMAAGTICSAALMPESSFELRGIDVRKKEDGKYVLVLGKENILLEERTYKLMKIVGKKKEVVAQGEAVYSGADLKNDTEAIWLNERAQIKVGKMTGDGNPKQVVVLKLKDLNRTFAFELFHK